jgi:predicted GNAT superfamily acetyltransferase
MGPTARFSPSTAQAPAVEVRDVRVDEMRACQAMQRRAWGIVEDGYVVPVATLAAVQRYGGLVLGAFAGEALVGFSFAFLGRVRGDLALYSQITAVDPDHQRLGIGRLLKLAQRERARALGLGCVAWSFDPLQAGNAWFNLGVLGARSHTYEVDLYGPRSDDLNTGLATDRLLAEWTTRGETGGVQVSPPDAVDAITTEPVAGTGLQRPVGRLDPTWAQAPHLRIEIPAAITYLKSTDADLANTWQQAVRDAFLAAFAAGYVAVGFARGDRPAYVLARPTPTPPVPPPPNAP